MTTRIITRKGVADLKTKSIEELRADLNLAERTAITAQTYDAQQSKNWIDWALLIKKELNKRNA